jgi:hypothetical protein
MSGPLRDQSRRFAAIVLALSAVSCARREPQATVSDLNWACGAARCTATFRISADGSDNESLIVLVRAYSGDSVASREIVGEHKEHLVVPAGQSRRVSASLDTSRAATRLRVILERAD